MADTKGSKGTSGVVVIGLGRFGTSLAVELAKRGIEVLGIDHNSRIVQSLTRSLTQVVTADSTDPEALRQLGVPELSRAVVAIGTELEAGILTASLLIDLGITDIWAKAVSREHGTILRRLALGLSVAKGFTDAMGGTIRAEDTPWGLTMVIMMPADGDRFASRDEG